MDKTIIIYGSISLAIIISLIISTVLFIKDRKSTKKMIFFTASATVFVMSALFLIYVATAGFTGIVLKWLAILSILGIPVFIIDKIKNGTARPLSKALLTVPLSIVGLVLFFIGIALLDIMFWGGDWP